MMKDIFRGVGIGCILAGGILYYTNSNTEEADIKQYEVQLESLQTELDKVKKELAVTQTQSLPISKAAESPEPNDDKVTTKTTDLESKSETTPVTKIILTIRAGSTSSTVATNLEKAGIIDNAKELERYLIDNGLTGRIQTGVHVVDTTMDMDTIVRTITQRKK